MSAWAFDGALPVESVNCHFIGHFVVTPNTVSLFWNGDGVGHGLSRFCVSLLCIGRFLFILNLLAGHVENQNWCGKHDLWRQNGTKIGFYNKHYLSEIWKMAPQKIIFRLQIVKARMCNRWVFLSSRKRSMMIPKKKADTLLDVFLLDKDALTLSRK